MSHAVRRCRSSVPRSRTRPVESATRRSTSRQTDSRWHSSVTSGRVSAMSMSLSLPVVTLTAARTGIPRSAASRGRLTGATSCTPSSKSPASTRPYFGFQPAEIAWTGASGRSPGTAHGRSVPACSPIRGLDAPGRAGTVLERRGARRIPLGPQRLGPGVVGQPRRVRSSTADDAQGD